MLQKLKDFIGKLKSNPDISSFDEAKTKLAIILPILQILEWEIFETSEVTPEFSVENRKVDFALRLNHTNKFFIEAKNPGIDLQKHEEQLLDYSFREGVELAILTNGITWWFYLPTKKGKWASRKFYTIDITQQDVNEIASKFVELLSKDNVRSGKAIKAAESIHKSREKREPIENTLPEAWEKIISEPDTLLMDLLAETTEKICGFKPEVDDVKQFLIKYINHPIIPSEKRTLSDNSHKRKGRTVSYDYEDRIEICLDSIYTPKKYALIPLSRSCRSFLPGFKVPFTLETDIGTITTKVTSGPKGTEMGDPETGAYIQGGLKPWYNKHRELKNGDKLIIEVIEPKRRYKLSISER